MNNKPTYQELEFRVNELENISIKYEQAKKKLRLARCSNRKNTDETLMETTAYLENLINYANAPIIVWDTDFKITRFNNAFEKLTGRSSQEVVGQELDSLFPETSRSDSLMKIRKTLNGEKWESVEIPILRTDGEVRIALWNSANIYAKDGSTLIATIAQGQDITERKKAESTLAIERQRLQLILEAIPAWVNTRAPDYSIPYANKQFIEEFGEPGGRPCYEVMHGRHQPCKPCPTFEVFKTKDTTHWEFTDPVSGRIFMTYANYFMDTDGAPLVLEIGIDITNLKHAQKQITASLHEKEVMLREIHHRVKNNLQIISSLLNLHIDTLADATSIKVLQECKSRIDVMATIHEKIYQSKDLANISFDGYVESFIYELFTLYRIAPDRIQLHLKKNNITLDIAHAIQCGLIINELVSNALKYAFPEGRQGSITVSLQEREANSFELIVGDDGIGLPENLQLANLKSLGLHLVYILAQDQLDGTIDVERSNGALFRIRFQIPD